MNKLILMAVCGLVITRAVAVDNEQYGGYFRVVPKNAGKFLFVNAQAKVPESMIVDPVVKLAHDLNYDLQVSRGAVPAIGDVRASLVAIGAKGAVWIVDDPTMPRVLAACEDGWAFLNVAQLSKDADDDTIKARMSKEINRVFGFIHGAADPIMMPACALKPAYGLKGLDKLQCKELSPITAEKVSQYLSLAGYKKVNVGTYYDACEEGWAPKPTNAVQKAIWDKVHALPTEPIKIKPEAKKVKE